MQQYDVVIVGAGFTGLTAAFELSKEGHKVLVLEGDEGPGGLAGTFEFDDGTRVEKFYHHWFNNDEFVPKLVNELGVADDIILLPTRTGMYFNGRIWNLSTPLDLLKFKALSFIDRIRLGLLVLRVRRIKDWHSIEHLSIREWLEPLCGSAAYKVVWEPLVTAKFSIFSERVNAVWMWKKLVLRGGTRNSKGGEELAYFKGGFGKLAEVLVEAIKKNAGEVNFDCRVQAINRCEEEANRISSIETNAGKVAGKQFLFTPSLSSIADIFQNVAEDSWLERLRRVNYLGNVCLVLRLSQSLSDTYWINVNDPGFPFVGIIEHTNFDSPENYGGDRIAYLSRYLAREDPVWSYTDKEYLDYAITHLKRMFPHFEEAWIVDYKVWRADFAQPITERHYSSYVPGTDTPFENAHISTMAHIYPEDRGTNYAIREGQAAAKLIQQSLST